MDAGDCLREAVATALYYGENDADKRTWQQAEEVADYYRIAAGNALDVLSSHPEAVLSLLGTVLPITCPNCNHKPSRKPTFTCGKCGHVKAHDEFEILLVSLAETAGEES